MSAAFELPPAANPAAAPRALPPLEEPNQPTGHITGVTQFPPAGGSNFPVSQPRSVAQEIRADGDHTSTGGQVVREAHPTSAARGPILIDPFLGILAETVTDLEENRKSLANRYRQLTRTGLDKDGKHRGLGLSEDAAEVKVVRELLVALGGERLDGSGGIEHQAVLKLQRRVRKHPLWTAWGTHQRGVGEKTLARLLSAVGDPYWNDLHDRPRTVSELWAFCGLHVLHPGGQAVNDNQLSVAAGVAPSRKRGQKANWSTTAKTRLYLIAECCLKAGGDYAESYREARVKYADSVHPVDCTRCGPKGKPALAGSPLPPAHQHARAMRILMKEILRDLWVAGKELHEADQ